MDRRLAIAAVAMAWSPFASVRAVAAPTYPDHAVKLILPFPTGSATDAVSRFIAEELRKELGQVFVVDNQAGADGIIAAQAVKRAQPDGYTLMVSTNSAHGTNKALYAQLPYDPEKDFEPVGLLMRIPQILVVKKDFPADDVATLLQLARKRAVTHPFSFGTGNTSSRVAGELLKASAGIEMTAVSYRGTPQALQDLVGGQIDLFFSDLYAAAGLIAGGQVKPLAIADTVRLPQFPQLPTLAEAGHKSVDVVSWVGVFAPARTDPAIVDRLNRAIAKVIAMPGTREYVLKMGGTAQAMRPDEFRRFVSEEIVRWGRLVEIAGIPKK